MEGKRHVALVIAQLIYDIQVALKKETVTGLVDRVQIRLHGWLVFKTRWNTTDA
jgi:hypothetical protein